MAKINVLSKEISELIAAGEVIDRPSSVVKELVENAIDAGASSITVEIQSGGIRLIRVSDNGCGIERDEVPKAFLRHATSKVLQPDDLDRIGTLGFRGEALASICAVTRVELLTRTAEETIGTRYALSGESAGELCEAGCPIGTTVTARDLFYNVPARMKFLKKDATEGAAVAALIDRLALSHPEISFKLIRDRETKLVTPGSGELLATIYAVYGNEFGRGLIPVECTVGAFTVQGYLAKPECCRASRSMEHFFINHRYVKSMTMLAAVEEAYRNSLMVGKFPGCILNLTLDPAQVDVNVHPAKLEVKLSDEHSVFDAVYTSCKGALAAMQRTVSVGDVVKKAAKGYSPFELNNRPNTGEQTRLSAEEYRSFAQRLETTEKRYGAVKSYNVTEKPAEMGGTPRKLTVGQPDSLLLQSPATENYISSLPPKGTHYGKSTAERTFDQEETAPKESVDSQLRDNRLEKPLERSTSTEASTKAAEEREVYSQNFSADKLQGAAHVSENQPGKLLGELFATYLLVEAGDKFLIVDKHAAHERILFNRLQSQHQSGSVERQLLLSPAAVTMPKDLYESALSHRGDFARAGFSIEDFGEGCVCVREIPAVLMNDSIEDLVLELAQRLNMQSESGDRLFDDFYHSVACKAAIKGNRSSTGPEQQELLRLLRDDPTVRNCPHGRPVMIELTRREVEKMFGRIV